VDTLRAYFQALDGDEEEEDEVYCSVLQRVAVWCGVVRCGAVWCSVVQCVAVSCCVMQSIAVFVACCIAFNGD